MTSRYCPEHCESPKHNCEYPFRSCYCECGLCRKARAWVKIMERRQKRRSQERRPEGKP